MINNLQDLLGKYKNKINHTKEIKQKILKVFENTYSIKESNIEVDNKNKTIKIKNVKSSIRFIFKKKDDELKEEIKKETGFNLLN